MFYAVTTYNVNSAQGGAFEEAIGQMVEYYRAQPGVNVVKLVKRTHIQLDYLESRRCGLPGRLAERLSISA